MPALNPIMTEQAINHLASGTSQKEVAQYLGVNKSLIKRVADNHRERIKQLALTLISESIPLIKSIHLNTLKHANNLLAFEPGSIYHLNTLSLLKQAGIEPKDILQLSDKKEHRLMQMMGILPSTTPSIVVNQLFNQATVNVLSPGVAAYIRGKTDDFDTVDADFEEMD